MSPFKGAKVGETFTAKAVVSAFAAIGMYWMEIPKPVVILLIMMGLDLFLGSIAAFVNEEFRARILWIGICKKVAAFPMLAACHLVESPLRLGFDLDVYVALALVMYEFISVVESYAKLGGPVPSILLVAADKARAMLSTTPDVPMKQVKTESTLTGLVPQPGNLPPAVLQTQVTEVHLEPVTPEKKPDEPAPKQPGS